MYHLTDYIENNQFDMEKMRPVDVSCKKCKCKIGYRDRIYKGGICKVCTYKKQGIELVTACPSLSIIIECPYCEHTYDILNEDDGSDILHGCEFLSSGSHYDYEVTCPGCEKEFLIDELQY